MIEAMHFAVDNFFFAYSIFLDDKILTQFVIYYRVPVNWETEKNEKKRKETEKKTKRKQGEK